MVIELSREEIEKAILAYIKSEVIQYGAADTYDIKITQGKQAKANVTMTEIEKITEPVEAK